MRRVTIAKTAVLLIGVVVLIGVAWAISPTPGVAILAAGLMIIALYSARRRPGRAPGTESIGQREQPSDQWRQMAQVLTTLSGTLDPQQALDLVSRAFAELTNADGTAVFIQLDDPTHTLALTRSTGFPAVLRREPAQPLCLSRSFSTLSPFVVQNSATDLRTVPIRRPLAEANFVSWVELPLLAAGKTEHFGALVAYYKQQRPFPATEIELLRVFADQAANAIRNSQIYRRTSQLLDQRVAQLLALAAINQELTSTLDPQHLFARVLDYALDGTSSVGGALLLRPDTSVPEESVAPKIVAQRGRDIRRTSDFLSRMTISRALNSNEPVIDRTIIPELSVPISRGEAVLGVITLYALEKDAFSPDDVLFVRYLATQAVIAVDNARLFSRVEENRNRLQIILDSMHEAVILIDIPGTLLLANRQIEYMFNLAPERIMGYPVETLLADKTINLAEVLGFEPTAMLDLIGQMQDGRWLGASSRQTYRIEMPTVRFIDRTIVSTHGANGLVTGMLLVFADATEDRELAQAREDLTRMIVHDLRAPLTAVTTSMHLLNDISSDDPRLQKALSRTVDASQRALRKLLHLVDSLLDIAKMESGTMTLERVPHLLAPVVQGVKLELAPLADDLEVVIDIDIADSIPPAFIDAQKIERVLLNLVDNALKFSPVGALVAIKAYPPNRSGFVRIDVSDKGPGIQDVYKQRIFDRFEQVNGIQGRRRGTGLGLTFCKLAVEAHGGRIWIEDNVGGGSVFTFTLPVTNKPVAADLPVSSPEAVGSSASPDRFGEQHPD